MFINVANPFIVDNGVSVTNHLLLDKVYIVVPILSKTVFIPILFVVKTVKGEGLDDNGCSALAFRKENEW